MQRTCVTSLAALALSFSLFACDSDGDSGAANDAGEDAAEPDNVGEDDGGELDAGLFDAGDNHADSQDAADTREVRVRFRARMGASDYGCDKIYPGQGSTRVDVVGQSLRFFVSDVRLLDEQGGEVPVTLTPHPPGQSADLALVNLQNPEGACGSGARTNTEITGTVPTGNYHGLRFRVGVPAELNHGDPAVATEPLRGSGLNWNWLQGYRFFVAEISRVAAADAGLASDAGLQASDAGDGAAPDMSGGGSAHGSSGDPGVGVLHLGSTGCTGAPGGTITCSKSNRPEIKLDAYDVDASVVVLDLSALFAGSDLSAGATCHARGEACGSMFTAFGLDYGSGMSLGTQRVFRLE